MSEMIERDEIYSRLEAAAIDLSDALTGGGSFAIHGADPFDILEASRRRDARLISSVIAMHDMLRELDRRRKNPDAALGDQP
jgi:hypothetical protein